MADAPGNIPANSNQAFMRQIRDLAKGEEKYRRRSAALRDTNQTLQSQLAEAQAQLATLTTERDDLKVKLTAAPGELQKRINDLTESNRLLRHERAFHALYNDQELGLNRQVAVGTLMNVLQYRPEGDEPDPAQLRELVAGARAAHPYLFSAPAEAGTTVPSTPAEPTRPAGEGTARGAPATATMGGFVVRGSQLRNATWMRENAAKIAEARKNGTLQFKHDA